MGQWDNLCRLRTVWGRHMFRRTVDLNVSLGVAIGGNHCRELGEGHRSHTAQMCQLCSCSSAERG